jgi:hypothetical protein
MDTPNTETTHGLLARIADLEILLKREGLDPDQEPDGQLSGLWLVPDALRELVRANAKHGVCDSWEWKKRFVVLMEEMGELIQVMCDMCLWGTTDEREAHLRTEFVQVFAMLLALARHPQIEGMLREATE